MNNVNMLTSRRGQLTLMLIVAVVILMAFISVYIMSQRATTAESTPIESVMNNLLQTTSFKYYATECLEDKIGRAHV